MGDMDQMLSGEEIDHSLRTRWLRKRGRDFQGRPCLVKEAGNLNIFYENLCESQHSKLNYICKKKQRSVSYAKS